MLLYISDRLRPVVMQMRYWELVLLVHRQCTAAKL